jgi:hypothetical protein
VRRARNAADGLVRSPLRLLRQQPDVASGGLTRPRPPRGGLAREHPQQRRLARAVDPDQPDDVAGPITRSRPENSTRAPWPAAREVALRVALMTTTSLRTRRGGSAGPAVDVVGGSAAGVRSCAARAVRCRAVAVARVVGRGRLRLRRLRRPEPGGRRGQLAAAPPRLHLDARGARWPRCPVMSAGSA